MATVVFSFNGVELQIQCSREEKMKDICRRCANKINKNINSLYFLYSGNQVNYELRFKDQANLMDRNRNKMNILVFIKEEEGLKCSNCGEVIKSDLFDKILKNEQNDILKELKNQLEAIIYLNDINKIKNQIKIVKYALENVINENEKNLKEIKNSFNNNNNIKKNENDNEKVDFLMKQLKIKDNEINALKSKTAFNLNPEELIPVIFKTFDGKLDYSIICKKTDKFNMIENKLYEQFPEYRETENLFLLNGNRINKAKTIQENNIRYSDRIILMPMDD